MSNYQKLDDFDIYWAMELIFTQTGFHQKSPWTPKSQLSPVWHTRA